MCWAEPIRAGAGGRRPSHRQHAPTTGAGPSLASYRPRRYARAVADAPIAALERVPLFANLDKKDLKAMSREMSERTFPQGADVTVTGHTGVGFFVIDDGNAPPCA